MPYKVKSGLKHHVMTGNKIKMCEVLLMSNNEVKVGGAASAAVCVKVDRQFRLARSRVSCRRVKPRHCCRCL